MSENRYFYKVTVTDELVKVRTTKKSLHFKDAYGVIDCELIQPVDLLLAKKHYTLWVDEEGKCRDHEINLICTALFNHTYKLCRDYIAGTGVIVKSYSGGTFTEEQAAVFESNMLTQFGFKVWKEVEEDDCR